MKKNIYRGMSLFLAMTVSVWSLAACGVDSARKSKDKNITVAAKVNEKDVEALLNSKMGDGADTEKKETVFVEMNADGNISKTTVSDVLKVSGRDNISDVSILDNIKNLSGDEKFTINGSELVWENKGKDISYQGTTTQEPPLHINITYYLDGEEIQPKELAGKSGKIKIVYDYVNESEKEGDFVPFIALTGMILGDNFTNIKVDNGKVLNYSESNIVIGYGAPGFKNNLTSRVGNAEKYMKDIDVPESFTVTADVEDFEMDMALTVAASDLGDMNLQDTLDFSDIEAKMDQLTDGTNRLEDGAADLYNGTGKLKDGSVKIDNGAKDIAKYTADLYVGTTKLLSGYNTFHKELLNGVKTADKGAKKLYKGTQSVKSASKELDNGAKILDTGAKDLNSAATQINTGANSLAAGLNSARKAFEDVKDKNGNVVSQGIKNGSKTLADGIKTANAGVKELTDTLQKTPDSIQAQIDDIIKQVSAATGGKISNKAALDKTVEGINSAVSGGMELSTVLQANNLNAKAYYQLVQAYYGIQTLTTVKSTFEEQINSKAKDMKTLLEGMNTLENGAATLSGGIGTLYTGILTLDTGAGTLADGTGQMSDGTKTLSSGTKTLSDGTGKLKTGADTLNKGMKSLSDGTKKMNQEIGKASMQVKDGIKTVDSGAGQISDGAGTLSDGTDTLCSGIVTLFDGTKTLKDGVIQLNKDGISKITGIFGEDAKNAVDSIEDILNNGKNYKSFTGINENMTGSVKFIFKTAEIKADK